MVVQKALRNSVEPYFGILIFSSSSMEYDSLVMLGSGSEPQLPESQAVMRGLTSTLNSHLAHGQLFCFSSV